jgi:hypothetical protein
MRQLPHSYPTRDVGRKGVTETFSKSQTLSSRLSAREQSREHDTRIAAGGGLAKTGHSEPFTCRAAPPYDYLSAVPEIESQM